MTEILNPRNLGKERIDAEGDFRKRRLENPILGAGVVKTHETPRGKAVDPWRPTQEEWDQMHGVKK